MMIHYFYPEFEFQIEMNYLADGAICKYDDTYM